MDSQFTRLLNNTRSGAIRGSVGISVESFLSSLVFSVTYCLLQVLIFVYLREHHRQFYDPFGNDTRRMTVRSYFHWLGQLFSIRIDSFEAQYGLEPYLFLRYVYLMVYMVFGIACLAIPILLPINYFCGQDNTASDGLDLFSTANISTKHTDKYILHFLVTLAIIVWYHHLMETEIQHCIQMKNETIIATSKDPEQCHLVTTLLLSLPDGWTLDKFGGILPMVADIWYVRSHQQLETLVQRYKETRELLETFEARIIKGDPVDRFIDKPIGRIDIPGICERVDRFDYLSTTLKCLSTEIRQCQCHTSQTPTNKVFVRFKNLKSCIEASQLLLSSNRFQPVQVAPKDIIWSNMYSNDTGIVHRARQAAIHIAYIFVIFSWVVPVAVVGSISQLPYLAAIIPTIGWINRLPTAAKAALTGILPTIMLTCLTSLAIMIFEYLCHRERLISATQVETKLQNWIFLFSYFHLFFVITISSGIIVVIQSFIYSPASIPYIVATDLPKASNFFFSFFLYRGLTLFGNALLQSYRFFTEKLVLPLFDKTPRQIYHRSKSYRQLPCYWGQIYPTFSVYGSIALVYSVISPLVLLFCCINFILDLLSYKYLISYQVKRDHVETYGKLYPMAWKQLYAGIYSLIIFLTGLLFLVSSATSWILGTIMIVVLLLTIWKHILLNRKYNRYIATIPLDQLDGRPPSSNLATSKRASSNLAIRKKYLHPSFHFNPDLQVWIPDGPRSIQEQRKLEVAGLCVKRDAATKF